MSSGERTGCSRTRNDRKKTRCARLFCSFDCRGAVRRGAAWRRVHAPRITRPPLLLAGKGSDMERCGSFHGGPDPPSAKPFSCSNDAHVFSYFTTGHNSMASQTLTNMLFRIFAFLSQSVSLPILSFIGSSPGIRADFFLPWQMIRRTTEIRIFCIFL